MSDTMEPPTNAIAAVAELVDRSGDDQEKLGWAIVLGELERLQKVEATVTRSAFQIAAAAGTDAPRRLAGAVDKDGPLTGCGPDDVEAVIELVLEWQGRAARQTGGAVPV